MNDLEQDIHNAQALEADAHDLEGRAQDAARIAARITARLVVVRAEYRAGLRDWKDREMRALTTQQGAAEKLASGLRLAVSALYDLACNPPSPLIMSETDLS